MRTTLMATAAPAVGIFLMLDASPVSAQYEKGSSSLNCVTTRTAKLEDYWSEPRRILENRCNRPVHVAWCNTGASEKKKGCGTGSQYYRQKTYLKPNGTYDNDWILLVDYSVEWAECPATEDRGGGFAKLAEDGTYWCEPVFQEPVYISENNFEVACEPRSGTPPGGIVKIVQAKPGIISVRGPGSTVSLNLTNLNVEPVEAESVGSALERAKQAKVSSAIEAACYGTPEPTPSKFATIHKKTVEVLIDLLSCDPEDPECKPPDRDSGKYGAKMGGRRN